MGAPQDPRSYCRVLDLTFPQRSRYSQRPSATVPSELDIPVCSTRRRRTLERPKDVHNPLTKEEMEHIDRLQEDLIHMFATVRSRQAK